MNILVVDPDPAGRTKLANSLCDHGHAAWTAEDGAAALAKLATDRPDAVVMDVAMPRLDGLETTRMLRANGNRVPILLLTSRASIADRVAGLDAGADDYLIKPYAAAELLARLRALLRRAEWTAGPEIKELAEALSFDDLVLDLQTREVTRGDRPIVLTRTEFTLLQTLLENPRRVLERGWLLHEVWGFDFPTSANSLEVYVGYLRKKTEAGGEPRLIHTVRGVGYVLRPTTPSRGELDNRQIARP